MSRFPIRRIGASILLGVVVIGAVATSWMSVRPGEVVVVRRLGRFLPDIWAAGPHFGWPFGLDVRTRLRVDEVRQIEVGRAGVAGVGVAPDEGEFLTGDRNLAIAKAVIQFRISDPTQYVVQGERSEQILARLAESSLARTFSNRPIDSVLREQRAQIAREVEGRLRDESGRMALGLQILGVSLTDVRPPVEVAPDFHAAQAAESDRDRRIREARTAAETGKLSAESSAKARLDRAVAEAERTRTLATARAQRFLQLVDEARKNRGLTARRLYDEMLRDVLPRLKRKVVLEPREPLDLSVISSERP